AVGALAMEYKGERREGNKSAWKSLGRLENRLTDGDAASWRQGYPVSLRILCAEDEKLRSEPGDVLAAEVADAHHERAHKFVRLIVRDLGARPHDTPRGHVDTDLVGWIARSGKRLHFDDPANPDIEPGEIVVGREHLERCHFKLPESQQ